jgi:membrane protease YdiL (CAAX protease family)
VLEPVPQPAGLEPGAPPAALPGTAASRPSRVVAAVEVVLASGLPTQLALGTLVMLAGLPPLDANGHLSMAYVVTVLTADTALLLALIAWRLHEGGERARTLMLGSARWPREAVLGLALLPLVFAGVGLTMAALRWAWPWLHNVEANPFETLARSPGNAALLLALVVVSGGLKEECQRAFVLHRFEQSLGGARAGLVIYSLVFGAGHMIQGYDVGIATMLLGLAWGLVFLRRRSIVAPAVCHAGFNAAQVVQFILSGA